MALSGSYKRQYDTMQKAHYRMKKSFTIANAEILGRSLGNIEAFPGITFSHFTAGSSDEIRISPAIYANDIDVITKKS